MATPEKMAAHETGSADSKAESETQSQDAAPEAESNKEGPQPEEPPRKAGGVKMFIMLALCLAVFLAALDAVIITTALPTIVRDIGASDSGFAWIGSAYMLANAASTTIWAKFSDIFGRKPILILANIVFLVGSLVAALADSEGMLIAARAVQGMGAGGLMVLVNICVSDLFSMRERGMYFGMVGAVWAIASGIGPILGGVFAQHASWRWCFYINLPCDGVSLATLVFLLKIKTPKTPLIAGLKAVDWLGALTIAGATLMLLLGLQFGGVTQPWKSAEVICLIVFGVIAFFVFFLIEWRVAKFPIIPLRIFKEWSSIAILVVDLCHAFCFIAVAYFLPYYFQGVLGASATRSGVWLLALALPLAVFTVGTGIYIRKTGRYVDLILFGLFMETLAFGLFISFGDTQNWAKTIIFQIIAACGVGPLFQAPLIALQSRLTQSDTAAGVSTFNFVRQLGSSMSVVIGQVIFQSVLQNETGSLLAAGLRPDIVTSVGDGTSIESLSEISRLPASQQMLIKSATTNSLQKVWIFYTAISAVGLLAGFFIGKRELSKQHEETKVGLEAERIKAENEKASRQTKSPEAAA